MGVPITYVETSKHINIMAGTTQIGIIKYLHPTFLNRSSGWKFFLDNGMEGTFRSTWTDAADECTQKTGGQWTPLEELYNL